MFNIDYGLGLNPKWEVALKSYQGLLVDPSEAPCSVQSQAMIQPHAEHPQASSALSKVQG